jgi:uncharacterized membrane protein
MKESLFAKALRGFFILLPFLVAFLLLGQLVDMLLALTQPLIDVMPGNVFETEGWRRLVAFGILIVICILVAQCAHTRMLVAIVEELEDGNLTVFVPMASTSGMGFLQIVSPSKLEKLECPMSDVLGWTLNWGAGTDALFKAGSSAAEPRSET